MLLPQFVLERVARVTVELAKMTWPQLWPSFVDDIYSLGDQVCVYLIYVGYLHM